VEQKEADLVRFQLPRGATALQRLHAQHDYMYWLLVTYAPPCGSRYNSQIEQAVGKEPCSIVSVRTNDNGECEDCDGLEFMFPFRAEAEAAKTRIINLNLPIPGLEINPVMPGWHEEEQEEKS